MVMLEIISDVSNFRKFAVNVKAVVNVSQVRFVPLNTVVYVS